MAHSINQRKYVAILFFFVNTLCSLVIRTLNETFLTHYLLFGFRRFLKIELKMTARY